MFEFLFKYPTTVFAKGGVVLRELESAQAPPGYAEAVADYFRRLSKAR